jgi:hypothetical protein
MKPDISVEAHVRYMAAPSAGAGLIIVLVLFLLTRIASVLSTLAFVALSAAVLAGLGVEIAVWHARGTRRIELSGRTLTLFSGKTLEPLRIERARVERTRIRSALGLRTLTLYLLSGERVRLSSQAFPEEQFSLFLEAMSTW